MFYTKLQQAHELKQALDLLKSQGKKIVFTNGCFDLIHAGHVHYLQKAKDLGDILVIGLNSDTSLKRLKGDSRPLFPEAERAEILSALNSVDFLCLFQEDTPFEIINLLKPNILVKGGDYHLEDIVGRDVVVENGGRVVTIPFLAGKSTTNIIEKVLSLT
ncbi:MAG: D-glycero-beta-D-manno-heptose 1-phosphate adenylyltransferase [bacterium]|nr:D-glycero-beta-D-manno-heptose 1-phosphate adenylyltransferase [bacterium]